MLREINVVQLNVLSNASEMFADYMPLKARVLISNSELCAIFKSEDYKLDLEKEICRWGLSRVAKVSKNDTMTEVKINF